MSASNERVMMFIDGSNMYHAIRAYSRKNKRYYKIDYVKLRDVLLQNRHLIRAYFFCSYDPKAKPVKFYDYLTSNGFEVVAKPLRTRQIGEKSSRTEKGVDVALAVKMLSLAYENAYDTAILVSGDSDYVEAVSLVKDKGKRVEIAAFRGTINREFRQLADRFTYLDDLADQILKTEEV